MAEQQVLLLQTEAILTLTEAVATIIQTEVQAILLPEAITMVAITLQEVIHHQVQVLPVLITVAAAEA